MEKMTEYISDGNRNYLRISCGEERKDSYPYKMITENIINGILPCRIRVVNGEAYLYYEVQSKQTLFYRYEIKELDFKALENLFSYLCTTGQELEKYLLNINHIVFNEKYIFQNIETGETNFLFLPNKRETEDTFAEFMEYVVKKINHKDMKAVQVSYKLYDLSRQERISVKEIQKIFELQKENKQKCEESIGEIWKENKQEKNQQEKFWTEEVRNIESKSTESKSTESKNGKNVNWEYRNEPQTDWNEKGIEHTERKKLTEVIIPCIPVIVLTVLICIKLSFRLTYMEEILWFSGVAVDIAAFFIYVMYKMYNKKEDLNKKNEYEADGNDEDGYFDIDIKEEMKIETAESKWINKECEQEETFGETVFLEQEPENILCGLGKYEKTTIKMDKFPFTIGKIKEETDYILRDNSVSRVHARFYQEGKEVYLMDLNSTNGTCKNGFRIPANEKIRLEDGDEISFGKIRFFYR